MKPITRIKPLFAISAGIIMAALTTFGQPVLAAPGGGGGGQASLVLENSAAALCHKNNTAWSIDKSVDTTGPVPAGTPVTFTIDVTKGATSDNTLCVDGYVSIRNGGTNTAYVGNIVVNLQKKVGNNWVSAGADLANAYASNTTTANIVASSSQENTNSYNYVKGNPAGTFSTTSASGALAFTDADDNSVFNISPTFNLGAGLTKNLKFTAEFNNTVTGIAAGVQVRAEILVTFAGAGARGGGGASASNIDADGNGSIDVNEANVRTVPTRITMTVPQLQACNDSVDLTDVLSFTGAAGFTETFNDLPTGPITESGIYTIEGTVSGDAGDVVTNTATLTGDSSDVVVNGPIDPLTSLPIYSYVFPCCVGVNEEAEASVIIEENQGCCEIGEYTTFTQGGWGAPPNGGNPGQLLATNFSTVYGSGFVEVGIPGADANQLSIKLTGSDAVCKYLPAGRPADALTVDINSSLLCSTGPSSPSTASGVFGGQVLALQLNVDFSTTAITPAGLGALTLCSLTTSDLLSGTALTSAQVAALNGQSIAQVLAEANTVLGSGTATYGLTVAQLNDLVDQLNNAFDNGTVVSSFASDHLCQ